MKCKTKYCRTPNNTKNKICSKCQSRIYKEKLPINAAFQALRANAKRRGKVFTLTLEYFTFFIEQNPVYLEMKGRKAESLHIDRIDERKGYEEGNLQLLPNRINSEKYREFISDLQC